MDKRVICLTTHLGEENVRESSSNIISANDSRLSSDNIQVIPKPSTNSIRELCERIFVTVEDTYEHLLDSLKEMGPEFVQLKKNNKLLSLDLAKEKNDKLKLATKVQELQAKNDSLETELSNLKIFNDAECTVDSVSPRCEANNLVNDRVEMLEKENSKLNNIIKSFTNSQQCLNSLVGGLGKNSDRQALGFQSHVQKTKPKKAKLNKFASFLSQLSEFAMTF